MMFKKIPRCTLGYRFLVVVTGAVAIYLCLLLKTNWSYDQNRTPAPQQLIQNVLNVQASSAAERMRKSYINRTAFADGKKNQIEVLSKQNVYRVSLKTAKADTRSLTKQVQKPVNENDLKKPKYGNDINSWKGANGVYKPVNGEVLKKPPDVERLNKTIEGQGGIETVDMIGSNVHEPVEGEGIHTPLHRESVYRQLIDEHIDKPLNGDSVHKPLKDKKLDRTFNGEGLTRPWNDEGLKKSVHGSDVKITEDIPDVNGTEGTSVVNKSEHFSEVISNRVEDDSISSVIKGALGLKTRVHASGSKRKKTLAAMKSTLNKTRDVLHLNKTQNGLSSQEATKQSNSPRMYNTLYPKKAISEPGKVSGPPGAGDKQTASKPKRLTDNKHNASKPKSLTDDKQIASKPESLTDETQNASKPKSFTDDKKTPEFSNSSKSFHVSDPSKPVLCHTFSPGRLGNHLFEYASILGIAHKLNKTFFFRNDEEMKRILKYPPVQNHRDQLYARCRTAKHLQERYLCRFDENLLKQEASKDYTVDMYLQSWVYFAELLPEMKKAVTFADDIVQTATKVVEGFRAKFPNTTFVGVHNRRGDLTKKSLISQGYRVASPDFFVRALTYFRERFSRVKFLVLGEDPQWNRDQIVPVNDDVIVLQPSSSPAVDIQILSLTDHMIRTVGTFGWWAAFKIPGNPTVVYLKDFVKKNSPLSTLYSKDAADYMLPEWIAM